MSGFKYSFRFILLAVIAIHLSIFSTEIKNSQTAPPLLSIQKGNILIKIETSMGEMFAELYHNDDPITVEHFLKYVDNQFYNNLIFHRIIEGFVIQTGGYNAQFSHVSASGNSLKNFSKINKLKNTFGTLGMARLESDPDSALTEFYINLLNNPKLDATENKYGYTVFGKIIQGIEVAKKISSIKTWERDGLLYAPFFPNEALIKDITRVTKYTTL